MQIVDIPSPGFVSNGTILRREAYKAINTARTMSDLTKGQATTGVDLRAFFLACAELCPVQVKQTATKETA